MAIYSHGVTPMRTTILLVEIGDQHNKMVAFAAGTLEALK